MIWRRTPESAETGELGRSVFLDCLDPQFQRRVFALWVAEVRAKFLLVTPKKQVQFVRDDASQVPDDVISITLDVALEFCQRKIVSIQPQQTQVLKRPREASPSLLETTLVFVGWLRNGDNTLNSAPGQRYVDTCSGKLSYNSGS